MMQVSFDTASPAEVSAVVALLTAFGAIKTAPAAPPFPSLPAAPAQAGLPPIPADAPAGSYWVKTPGAPSLHAPDGSILAVNWLNNPPTLAPLPPRTVDPAADAAGKALYNVLTGNVS